MFSLSGFCSSAAAADSINAINIPFLVSAGLSAPEFHLDFKSLIEWQIDTIQFIAYEPLEFQAIKSSVTV